MCEGCESEGVVCEGCVWLVSLSLMPSFPPLFSQSEVRLMEQIIPPQHHQHVLDNLTRQPIEFFMRDGEVEAYLPPLSSFSLP